MNVAAVTIPTYAPLPSRRSWGECFWTARDICLTNQPEPPLDGVRELMDEFERRIQHALINGERPLQ